jgi:hypothetical protein
LRSVFLFHPISVLGVRTVNLSPASREGEKMAVLCRDFGISRKTGYKIFELYKDHGLTAFTDRSRRPHRQANRLPSQLEAHMCGRSGSTPTRPVLKASFGSEVFLHTGNDHRGNRDAAGRAEEACQVRQTVSSETTD